jgi:hypothetical protein
MEDLNQGARTSAPTRAQSVERAADANLALSFIRTVTVGPGFTPGLLTPRQGLPRALAG